MMELTKELLKKVIKYPASEASSALVSEMARQLLAGAEQEPVAYYFPGGEREIEQVSLPDDIDDGQKANCIPLYAAPQLPQPVVGEPVTWISRNKKTGEVTLAEPHEVATNPEYWTDGFPAYGTPISAPLPPEMSPDMMRAVQLNSELGVYATANLAGAYDLFAEFWKVACRAAMLQGAEPVQANTLRDGWVAVPAEMTPEQMRAVQRDSSLGTFASAHLSGAYDMYREFWDVAIAAAPQQEVK